ncbi:hypothetical protein BGZ49_000426, partial [Haplosporangium sp. Z 27]
MSVTLAQENNSSLVLIVGAGLGGLMLGAILETANINYHILERATEARPLGSAISLTGDVLPIFEQLGIYEDLKKASFSHIATDFYDSKQKKSGSIEIKGIKSVYVHTQAMIPKLYELIRSRVPEHKVSMGKKVLRTKEENDKVIVYCSDNTAYECDILVGADGAYSPVRQSMYRNMEEEGKLPSGDKEEFSIGYITMVGIANPPNPEKYPELSDDRCHFRLLIGDINESSYSVTAPNSQICWGLQFQLSSSNAKEQLFRNSEWGPESIEATMKDFEDFPCALGGTMKDLFDATPKNLISKVFLEEKIFQTWHHGRSVLIGDACHKILPGAGQGAVMAMKDAVVLANCIFNMKDYSTKSVKSAFESYYSQRFTDANSQFKNSSYISKFLFGQKWFERALRYMMLNFTPYWLMKRNQENDMAHRPQINWLPLVSRGIGKVHPQ